MRKHYDCGIDLGETTACIAVPDDDRGYRIIENKVDRLLTTPCAVSITRTGRVIAGLRAANSMNPEDLALLFRKHMGTDKVFQFPALGIQKSPEELSSYILSSLYSNASHSVNAQIKDAVITVPASFTSLQSDATVRAGKAAGFRNILLLPEPIAVLYAYGLHTDPTNRKWMVINCGKSCFTVDIVSSQDIQISIVSSEETDRFSDDAIARLLCRKIIFPALNDEGYTLTSLTNENSPVGKAFLRKIHQECEHCTDALINNAATSFELFDIEDDNGTPVEFELEVTRAELDEILAETMHACIFTAQNALNAADLHAGELNRILIVTVHGCENPQGIPSSLLSPLQPSHVPGQLHS